MIAFAKRTFLIIESPIMYVVGMGEKSEGRGNGSVLAEDDGWSTASTGLCFGDDGGDTSVLTEDDDGADVDWAGVRFCTAGLTTTSEGAGMVGESPPDHLATADRSSWRRAEVEGTCLLGGC